MYRRYHTPNGGGGGYQSNEVTLFRRFGSKKNLLMAAVEQEAEHFVAAEVEYKGEGLLNE